MGKFPPFNSLRLKRGAQHRGPLTKRKLLDKALNPKFTEVRPVAAPPTQVRVGPSPPPPPGPQAGPPVVLPGGGGGAPPPPLSAFIGGFKMRRGGVGTRDTVKARTPPASPMKRTLPTTNKERTLRTRDPRSGRGRMWWTAGTTRRGAGHRGLTHTETQRGRVWTA